jgi:FMN-dependent NADH-azoreductase
MIVPTPEGFPMRFLLGLIFGVTLTVVAAFVMDQREQQVEKRVVNWDVVNEKVGAATKDAQEVWSDFTSELTGP